MTTNAVPAGLFPVRLSDFGLRREPPRPPAEREPGYEERYDSDTLLYDVFAAADGRAILGIGPPLLNCEPLVRTATFRRSPGGEPLQHSLAVWRTGALLRIDVPDGDLPAAVSMNIGERAVTIAVQPSNCRLFAGRRVIYTLSMDNPLEWIQDWARFNVRVHGADAVIIYDNNSRRYGTAELNAALAGVAGLESWLVVDWRFPYGPGLGPKGQWDSYCQDRALAHMRFRCCALAAGVLNSDIDELVVPLTGRSVFERLAASGEPCLTYAGRWVTAARPKLRRNASLVGHRVGAQVQHSDCLFLEDAERYPNKWVADPRRCPDDALWLTHSIIGLPGKAAAASDKLKPTTAEFEFRHCRQISTDWKYDRARLPVIGGRMRYDRPLAQALMTAFPERHIFRSSGGLVGRTIDFLRQN